MDGDKHCCMREGKNSFDFAIRFRMVNSWQRLFNRGTGYCRRVDTETMADRKNKLGLSVAIGAGVGAALGVALHHLPLWLSLGCVGGIVTGIILTRMTRS
jgi:hypothetical protein